MTTLMERVANERRRLRTVRQNMLAATEEKLDGNESRAAFYIATADYIDVTMQRLHRQDIRMGEMIKDKVESMSPSVKQALAELEERLEGAKRHLGPFLAARDALQEKGLEALAIFEKEAKIYSDFIVANMGHHGPTSDLSAELFSGADWEHMAEVTDAEVAREAALFDRVDAAKPASLKSNDS
jgi:hypothetical protein